MGRKLKESEFKNENVVLNNEYEATIKSIQQNIRVLRKKLSLSSKELGEFIGISTAYVGLIERKERTPSLEILLKICRFFGETPVSLAEKPHAYTIDEHDFPSLTDDGYCEHAIKNLSRNVYKLRKERGLSTIKLGEVLNVASSYAGLLERGERSPSFLVFWRICKFFGKSPDEMLGLDEANYDRKGAMTKRKRDFVVDVMKELPVTELKVILQELEDAESA